MPTFDAERLQSLYEAQLEAASTTPGGGDSRHGRQTFRAMLRASRRLPALRLADVDEDGTWFWSDLHLGHDNIIRYANRPFVDAKEMDERLYANWKATVGADDTLIFVGDVAMREAVGEHTWQRVRGADGKAKHLVFGNHDLTARGDLRVDGFDGIYAALCIDGPAPLLCTHMPLGEVPSGCVNVHGHTHEEAPRRSAHINVSVEQLNYRPLALTPIRALAAELAAGRYPPGETTLARVSAVMGHPAADAAS